MHSIVITGGTPLNGKVACDGAKNAALPILAGALLTDGCLLYTSHLGMGKPRSRKNGQLLSSHQRVHTVYTRCLLYTSNS